MSWGDLKAAIEARDTAIAMRKRAEESCDAALQRERELRAELDAAKLNEARARLNERATRDMLDMLDASRERAERKGEEARGDLYARRIQELQAQMTAMVEAQPHRLVHAFATEVASTPPPGGPPRVPDDAEVRLRLRLIAEEFFEVMWACLDRESGTPKERDTRASHIEHPETEVMHSIKTMPLRVDLPEFVDGLADLLYVVHGAALAFGVHMPPVFAEVHRSNMAKKGGPVVNGKLRKPPGWTPPDIASELMKQGWGL